jgi:hypothetical protein
VTDLNLISVRLDNEGAKAIADALQVNEMKLSRFDE